MPHLPPEQWRSLFQTVDRTEIAASLLDYSTYWRTPDGSERMPELSMQQAAIAVDHVIAATAWLHVDVPTRPVICPCRACARPTTPAPTDQNKEL